MLSFSLCFFFHFRFGNRGLCRLVSTLCSVLAVLSSALMPKTLRSASSAQRSSLGKRRWCLPMSCAITWVSLEVPAVGEEGSSAAAGETTLCHLGAFDEGKQAGYSNTHTAKQQVPLPWAPLLLYLALQQALAQSGHSTAGTFSCHLLPGHRGLPLSTYKCSPPPAGAPLSPPCPWVWKVSSTCLPQQKLGGIIFLFPSAVFQGCRAGCDFFLTEPFLWH